MKIENLKILEEKLLKLTEEKKVISDEELKIIISDKRDENNLRNQLVKLEFNKSTQEFGSYDSIERKICINNNLIAQLTRKSIEETSIEFPKTEVVTLINLKIMQTVMHELQHVMQASFIEQDNKIDKNLIKLYKETNNLYFGSKETIMERIDFIERYYNCIPDEYNAEFMANKQIASLVKKTNLKYYLSNQNYFTSTLIDFIKTSYIGNAPTVKFLKAIKKDINEYDFTNLSEEEKLENGLVIKSVKINF